MKNIRVSFKSNRSETLSGIIIDRYSGIEIVTQEMPSGVGGIIDLKFFQMNADFYLISADDGTTHHVRCNKVHIEHSDRSEDNLKEK